MAESKKRANGQANERPLPAKWVRGTYTLGLEVSAFRPKGSKERWWTSFKDADSATTAKLSAAARAAPVDVELLGVVSKPGAYGHMGMYEREFTVQEIRTLPAQEKERKP